MKIGIDTRPLYNQSATRGIGVVTSHLVRYLSKLDGVEVFELKEGKLSDKVDLIHYPFFDLYYPTLPLWKKFPTVVTIHDVTPLVLSELYPAGWKGRLIFQRQKWALKNVDAVMADSDISKDDAVRYLKVNKEKVFTVYLSAQDGLNIDIGEKLLEMVRTKYHLPERFVLYVGDVNMNKNVLNLVEACKKIELPLVIVGKQAVNEEYDHDHPETKDLVVLQNKYGNDPMVRRLGFVPVEELSAVYRLAVVYCQPSLYEGFGVPVLEAMMCSCPVIASKRGSLPEIGGGAAIYTEPSLDKLAGAIQFVLNLSNVQRTRLVQEGKRQASKFSWEKTASQTVEVYKKVLGVT